MRLRPSQDPQRWERYQGISKVPSPISWDQRRNCSWEESILGRGSGMQRLLGRMEKARAAEQGRRRDNTAGKVPAMSEVTQGAASVWSALG